MPRSLPTSPVSTYDGFRAALYIEVNQLAPMYFAAIDELSLAAVSVGKLMLR